MLLSDLRLFDCQVTVYMCDAYSQAVLVRPLPGYPHGLRTSESSGINADATLTQVHGGLSVVVNTLTRNTTQMACTDVKAEVDQD